MCDKEVNFLRIIDFMKNPQGNILAYDSHCVVFNKKNVPSLVFVIFKQIKNMERNLPERELSPRITSLF